MKNKIKLFVSSSPHIKSPDTVTAIMLDVIIALAPAGIVGIAVFGWRAALVIAVCVASCVFFELASRHILKRPFSLDDLSAVVTGLLLAYNLPVNIPVWMCVIGSFVAIVVAKQLFGGIGKNFANPAITGRIVLLVSFASAMSSYPLPRTAAVDAVTTATPLTQLAGVDLVGDVYSQVVDLNGSTLPNLLKMLIGERQGCIGEVGALALIAGGIYLICRRVIDFRIPLCYIGSVGVIMLIASHSLYFTCYELLSGGLLLGAIFMATDYTTSPVTKKGRVIFGIMCGIITSVIRLYGSLPEGVSYSILLMNIACPLIEKISAPHYFGFVKQKKDKKVKEAKAE